MPTSELKTKAAELEASLQERMSEASRTKTTDAEDQELLDTQAELKAWLSKVENGESDETSLLNQGDELLRKLQIQI